MPAGRIGADLVTVVQPASRGPGKAVMSALRSEIVLPHASIFLISSEHD